MQTGKRFWQLISFVFFILIVYGLMELSDAIAARQLQLKSQQQLLSRQEALLRDNHWPENLRLADQARKAWMSYLPVEKSPTFAKARLLSDLRHIAKEAGIANLTVTATDAEGGDKASDKVGDKASAGNVARPLARFGADKNKDDLLPVGVQMIKLTLSGRFDPVAFNKLMQKQEEVQRFLVIDRVTVRGAQLELGIRSYWRIKPNALPGTSTVPVTGKPALLPAKNGF
ncbi:MAG: hypothetical protein Q7T62_11295 [Undibacterium sp.]|nr:hypothetical protein [Undibacterium sp.]